MRRLHPNRLTMFDIAYDLLPTDRIYQRWARSVGSGLQEEDSWEARSSPTELPTDAAVWVDQYVCHRHDRMRKFIHAWYRGQDASSAIARRFNVEPYAVYNLWRGYLAISRDDFMRADVLRALMTTPHLIEAA